ncbi:MAG: DNA recombination protein RmuC [Succinatimonas hippei]|nr:DNA recombination protein RmuC [Succinatimonas hippei]
MDSLGFELTSVNITAIILSVIVLAAAVKLISLSRKLSEERRLRAIAETTSEQLKQLNSITDAKNLDLEQRNSALQDELAQAREHVAAVNADNQRLDALNADSSRQLEGVNAQLMEAREQLASRSREVENLKQLRETDAQAQENARHTLEERLTALSERMLKDRGQDLQKSSAKTLSDTVIPLKEELLQFRELLLKAQKDSSEQAGRFSSELKHMQDAQQSLSKQALDLTNALKSGGKAQGMWGELQLERALDASGLIKGTEYEREVAGDRALGETGRPDVVIRLPDSHSLIIDAKCSLTAYTEYCSADSDEDRERAAKAHLESIRSHIDGLSQRDYGNYRSLNSPSFVFMFVPLDGALFLAFNRDHAIYDYAASKNIYLVSPSTLVPALRVVSNLWILAHQNDHIRDLATSAKKIADKFDLVRDAFSDVLKRKDAFESSLEVLGNRLINGKGNLASMLSRFSARAPEVMKEIDGTTVDVSPEKDDEGNKELKDQNALGFKVANDESGDADK